MFFDKSKTIDRVWNDGLLFKLKQNGVSGNLFQLITSFLSGRFQRVILNDFYTIMKTNLQNNIFTFK